jgi:hypothetical protein
MSAFERMFADDISSMRFEVEIEYWYDKTEIGVAVAITRANRAKFFLETV